MRTTIAVLNKHGEPALKGVVEALGFSQAEQPSYFGVATPTKRFDKQSVEALSKRGVDSPALIGYAYSKRNLSSNVDFLNLEDATLLFDGKVFLPVPDTAVMEQLVNNPSHCETLLQTLIEKSEGQYSFLLLKKDSISAGRDPIGVQPLYFGENKDIAAFASNKKALWKLGIEKPLSFPPGNLAFVNRDGFKFKPVNTLAYAETKPTTMEKAAETLQVLLEQSIKIRVYGVKQVAVAFSGGLDSSLVAFLANKCGAKVHLIHVSLENQPETEEAMKAADELKLPMQVHLFKESDVEKILPKVLNLIEEPDPIKASIGVPFYWAAEKAFEEGFKVMLAGQGADELFGGYQRYVNELCLEGSEKVRKTMFDDVATIYESNIERDEKICIFHDVDLRLPFASLEIANFALSLPVETKIENKPDCLRKLVLRKAALNMGLSGSMANKPKKAVQYSTGINTAIKKLAKKQGKTPNEYINEMFQNQIKRYSK